MGSRGYHEVMVKCLTGYLITIHPDPQGRCQVSVKDLSPCFRCLPTHPRRHPQVNHTRPSNARLPVAPPLEFSSKSALGQAVEDYGRGRRNGRHNLELPQKGALTVGSSQSINIWRISGPNKMAYQKLKMIGKFGDFKFCVKVVFLLSFAVYATSQYSKRFRESVSRLYPCFCS